MRSAGLIILVSLGLIGGLIWQAPLSFALRQSGVASTGISWSQARGTIWQGQVTDIAVQQRKIGSVDLSLKPASLGGGKLEYRAQWVGPAGRGVGDLSLGTDTYSARNLSASINLSNIPDVVDEFKQADATFRMSRANIVWGRYEGCKSAGGELQTDIVRLVGHRIQKAWPDLTGTLSCDEGSLVADLSGESQQGEEFNIVFYFAASEPVKYRANISGVSPDIQNALALYGFKLENGAYTLTGNSIAGNAH